MSNEDRATAGFSRQMAKFIPFRDMEAAERAGKISRSELTHHPNPDFHIRIIDDPAEFYFAFALDIVTRIRQKLEAGQKIRRHLFPSAPCRSTNSPPA